MVCVGWCARVVCAIFRVCIAFFALGTFAKAAAFLQDDGHGQIIVSSAFDRSDRFFDASGKLQPLAQYRKFEMTTYGEFGATGWLTLIFSTTGSQSIGAIGLQPTADRYMRVEAGARAKLWSGGASLVSMQMTVRAPYALDRGLPPGLRQEVFETDTRLMYGYNFQLMERPGFASIEAGYRLRAGAGDEWRFDVTLGYRPFSPVLLLLQNFNVIAKAAGPVPAQRSHKLQVSAVYDVTPVWSVQGGVYAVLLGTNVRRELGVLGGLWRRF